MGDQAADFWPDVLRLPDQRAPVTILREQAGALYRKTKGLLEGEVRTLARFDQFEHSFYVVAPALDRYGYELFSVSHGVDLYPVSVKSGPDQGRSLASEQEFSMWLKQTLGSKETLRVLSALLAQVET